MAVNVRLAGLVLAVLLCAGASSAVQKPERGRVLPLTASAPATYGPKASIACPAGAVAIAPGASLQAAVTANPAGAAFCLKPGVHPVTASITPKSGNTFVGEFGAILDGSGWGVSGLYRGAIMAHLQDIDDVTIRNLVFQRMPGRAIHGYPTGGADRWLIEDCELRQNGRGGIMIGNAFTIRRTSIHHNAYAGYESTGGAGDATYGGLWEDNEIAFNGDQQKFLFTKGLVMRRNFVHHNLGPGIWYDGENLDALIEDNTVEDNAADGIFYEVNGAALIRRNVLRRNGGIGIHLSASQDVEITENDLTDNFRGIQYMVDLERVGKGGETPWKVIFDLKNNRAHHNTVRIVTRTGAYLSTLFVVNGSSTAYINGSKNLTFTANTYVAPTLTGAWFNWDDAPKTWTQWRAFGLDVGGTVEGKS